MLWAPVLLFLLEVSRVSAAESKPKIHNANGLLGASLKWVKKVGEGQIGEAHLVKVDKDIKELNLKKNQYVIAKHPKEGNKLTDSFTAKGRLRQSLAHDGPELVKIYGFAKMQIGTTKKEVMLQEYVNSETDAAHFYQDVIAPLAAEHPAEVRRFGFNLARDMAKGVSYLHAANIAHLDMHAGNVFVRVTTPGWRKGDAVTVEMLRRDEVQGVLGDFDTLHKFTGPDAFDCLPKEDEAGNVVVGTDSCADSVRGEVTLKTDIPGIAQSLASFAFEDGTNFASLSLDIGSCLHPVPGWLVDKGHGIFSLSAVPRTCVQATNDNAKFFYQNRAGDVDINTPAKLVESRRCFAQKNPNHAKYSQQDIDFMLDVLAVIPQHRPSASDTATQIEHLRDAPAPGQGAGNAPPGNAPPGNAPPGNAPAPPGNAPPGNAPPHAQNWQPQAPRQGIQPGGVKFGGARDRHPSGGSGQRHTHRQRRQHKN